MCFLDWYVLLKHGKISNEFILKQNQLICLSYSPRQHPFVKLSVLFQALSIRSSRIIAATKLATSL